MSQEKLPLMDDHGEEFVEEQILEKNFYLIYQRIFHRCHP